MREIESTISITIRPKLSLDIARATLTEDQVRVMWRDGRDFTIASISPPISTGSYINIDDYIKYAPMAEVRCRFNRDADLVILEERKTN